MVIDNSKKRSACRVVGKIMDRCEHPGVHDDPLSFPRLHSTFSETPLLSDNSKRRPCGHLGCYECVNGSGRSGQRPASVRSTPREGVPGVEEQPGEHPGQHADDAGRPSRDRDHDDADRNGAGHPQRGAIGLPRRPPPRRPPPRRPPPRRPGQCRPAQRRPGCQRPHGRPRCRPPHRRPRCRSPQPLLPQRLPPGRPAMSRPAGRNLSPVWPRTPRRAPG
jgi:hypothetical protein